MPAANSSLAAAIGYGAATNGQAAVAVGHKATANKVADLAIGDQALADSTGPGNPESALGYQAHAVGSGTVIGALANAATVQSTALAANSTVSELNGTAIGFGAQVQAGATNVAAGVAGTDAANAGQLNAAVDNGVRRANAYTNQQVGQLRSDVDGYRKDATAGSASAMALGLSSATQKWMVKGSLTTNTRGSVGAGLVWATAGKAS